MVLAAVLMVAVASLAGLLLLRSGDDQTGKPASPTTPTAATSIPTDGSIPEVTQPLDKVQATLEVDSRTASRDRSVTISHSITNTSDVDLKASTTSILVLVGASPGSSGIWLSNISQASARAPR